MARMLAQTGKIGNLEIKNRMAMTAMGDMLAGPDCMVGAPAIAYYEARAKGGMGLIFTGIVRVNDTDGAGGFTQLSLADDKYIPNFKKLVQAVQKHGTKLFVQLQHPGRQSLAKLTGGPDVVAPSAIPSAVMQQPTRALTTEEVRTVVAQFGDAACRAMQAGADGVEIHGAHGYLINQFLSPFSNKRTDEYGGSFENRMRFLIEIMRDVRAKTQNKLPVTVRLSVDEYLAAVGVPMPYIDLEEGVRIAKAVEAEGVEALNVSCGTYETMNFAIEPISFAEGWRKDFIQAVKQAVKVPVIAVAKFRQPAVAEAFLQQGIIDFAGFARPVLADENFAQKALDEQDDSIRKCISCLFCFEQLNSGSHVVCAMNPRTGFETEYPEKPKAATPKKVAVVGAGPAGLAAAVTLKEAGHEPTLFERAAEVGGQVVIGKNPPKKEQMAWLLDYYNKKIKDLGIDLRTGQAAGADAVKALGADAVLVACGSQPIVPSIPGVGGPNVYSVEQVLSGAFKPAGKTVAVVGSGLTGLETAETLQQNGNATLIVEMQEGIAPGAYFQNVVDVRSRLAKTTEYLTQHQLVGIKPDAVVLKNLATGAEEARPVDAVVLAVGYKPDAALIDSFAGAAPVVQTIGDAAEVKNIGMATRSGYRAAYGI
ncbi:MAG: FAD-dependent oxidoreductase [Ruminococcaceae bacterium]|nr:FAD-dependent oxidoreductase [Oscillospiraceae bacterium]